jgi:glycosyltransferase involved in cell wall biosynthesis
MNILVTGYAFVRKNFSDVFKHYQGNVYFLLPKVWKVKNGKVIYRPPEEDNIFTTETYFHHSRYPLVGGSLKGWMPYLPLFLLRQRKNKFDILFSATEPSLLTALYQSIWAKIFGIKHVLFTWENIPYQNKFRGLNLLSKRIIIKLNMFLSNAIVCGNHKAAAIMKEYTNKPTPVIPMSGVDEEFFKHFKLEKKFKDHDFRDKIVYSFIGSISYRKGIHLIIMALKDVVKNIPNAVLVIAGSGEYEAEINKIIEKTGIAQHIIRIPWMSHEEMRELLSVSDIFVYPSLSYKGWEEQFGYSMAEASLMELPVISTTSGSIEEVVSDGTTGLLVKPDDQHDLGRAMLKLGLDEELRKELGQAGREYIIENFSNKVIAEKFYRFFSTKKLTYIANLRLPTEKAYGIQIAKMCEAFADNGAEVNLIFPLRKNPHIKEDIHSYYSIKNNFKTKRIWAPDFYFPGRLDVISVLIKSFISAVFLSAYALSVKSEVIYSRDELLLFLLSFFKKNLTFEAHNLSKSRNVFYRRFKKINLKVVVITKRLKEDFVKIGFSPENILVVPDGVDLDEFNIDVSKEDARNKVGLSLNAQIAMYTGHLFDWKGADTILEVARQCKDVLFVFVGGMTADIEKFRKKAKLLMLENVLIFGHRPHKDVPLFLKAADILLLPNSSKEEISRSHTSPLKLFEYMASARPIIASDLPSLREILDENTATFAIPNNPNSWADKIRSVMADSDLRVGLSSRALEKVKNYTWAKRAEKIISFV